MATVNKTNLSITVYLHNGDTYDVDDGVNGNYATAAMYDFKAEKIIKVVDSGTEVFIPFHSVLKIEQTINNVSSTVTNDICQP